MTMARSLSRSLAPVVELLELDQPRVVTAAKIADLMAQIGGARPLEDDARTVAYELQRRGWLGQLRTRNVWEFLPGARAGAYGAGDRYIELRAQMAYDPDAPFVLAMESAAVLLGLSQHLPASEVVACPPGVRLPKGLGGWRVVHLTTPESAVEHRDGLPVWRVEALLVGIAARPSGYQDLAGLAQWLPDAGDRIDADLLTACIEGAKPATTQRCIYLLGLAQRPDLAERLARLYPPRTPVWFGTRKPGSRHDLVSKVTDADLAPLMSGGTGA